MTNSDGDDVPNVKDDEQLRVAEYSYPRGVLFANKDYTYFIEHVTEPGASDAFMVAGYNDSSTIDILEEGTALVTFMEHPEGWNGGGTLAQRPVQLDAYNVHYDLSEVSTVTFEIRSADFDVNQVSFGVQWEAPDYDMDVPSKRNGGEKLLTLEELGVDKITNWTEVSIDVSQDGDVGNSDTVRPEHGEVAFHMDAGNTFVKVPLMLIWAGRSHLVGESLEIKKLAFRNAAGEHVEIATNILEKAAEYAKSE
jgi:hypothetical protein